MARVNPQISLQALTPGQGRRSRPHGRRIIRKIRSPFERGHSNGCPPTAQSEVFNSMLEPSPQTKVGSPRSAAQNRRAPSWTGPISRRRRTRPSPRSYLSTAKSSPMSKALVQGSRERGGIPWCPADPRTPLSASGFSGAPYCLIRSVWAMNSILTRSQKQG
jgi:hypothetical protein